LCFHFTQWSVVLFHIVLPPELPFLFKTWRKLQFPSHGLFGVIFFFFRVSSSYTPRVFFLFFFFSPSSKWPPPPSSNVFMRFSRPFFLPQKNPFFPLFAPRLSKPNLSGRVISNEKIVGFSLFASSLPVFFLVIGARSQWVVLIFLLQMDFLLSRFTSSTQTLPFFFLRPFFFPPFTESRKNGAIFHTTIRFRY